jgi:hypothetical protein
MTPRRMFLAVVWVCVALAIRGYGAIGGDAAILSGLLFLLWTLPFGVIWQFLLYERALALMSVQVAQFLGDLATMVLFVLFWFVLVPLVATKPQEAHKGREN